MINHFNLPPNASPADIHGNNNRNIYAPNQEINDIIKPIDKEDANSEIERGEVVYNPNTMLLHRATGQKHSKGGTPVHLAPNTFIFSDFKDLAISKKDQEIFEFKKGGTYKPKANTPAKVLEREIDLRHHNSMVNIVNNQKKNDKIANNTANLMVQKNLSTVGQIAYMQEKKKNFPDGQPEISQGTAPIYSTAVSDKINMAQQYPKALQPNKQYKAGGNVLPKFQDGVSNYDPTFWDYDNLRTHTPQGIFTQEHTAGTFKKAVQNANQTFGLNLGSDVNNPKDIDLYHNTIQAYYPNTLNSFYQDGTIAPNTNGWNDGYYHKDRTQTVSPRYNTQADLDADIKSGKLINKGDVGFYRSNDPLQQSTVYRPIIGQPTNTTVNPATGITTPQQVQDYHAQSAANYSTAPVVPKGNDPAKLKQGNVSVDTQLPFSTLQKLNLLDSAKDFSTIKTYYPLHQHQESVLTNAQLLDDQGLKNNINQSYFNASKQNQTITNPAMYTAANKELSGQRLDKLNEVTANVLQQNNQITNGEKQAFAQAQNGDAQNNRMYDRTYYDATNVALQNRDDMRDFKSNQFKTMFNDMSAKKSEAQTQLNMLPKAETTNQITNPDGTKSFTKEAIYQPVVGFSGISYKLNPNISPEAIKNIQATNNPQTNNIMYKMFMDQLNSLDRSGPKYPELSTSLLIAMSKMQNGNK